MKFSRWNRAFLTVFILSIILTSFSVIVKKPESFRIMFYNTENLFDTINNVQANDEEYLPGSEKHWNSRRYWHKIKNIYQVIAAAGDNLPPDIIGFSEVECMLPLKNLTENTPLSKYEYTIIHKDSPDLRGIDVALLCRKDRVKVISTDFINPFADEPSRKTRDILLACLQIDEDTIYVFVNHWPSRRGGESRSDSSRFKTSEVVRNHADSLFKINHKAKIIIMGDFNDEPTDKSLINLTKHGFVNLSDSLQQACKCGSYKYKSHWQMFDQMLVSKPLIANKGLQVFPGSLHIVQADYMLAIDTKYGGKTPLRTYLGPRYIGGFSDHLPIVLDIGYKD